MKFYAKVGKEGRGSGILVTIRYLVNFNYPEALNEALRDSKLAENFIYLDYLIEISNSNEFLILKQPS